MSPDFNFKFYHVKRLLGLIIVLFVLSEQIVSLLFEFGLDRYGFYLRFGSSTTILAGIFSFINTYLHKFPLLWNVLMKVPLVRGTYKGQIEYFFGEEKTKECTFVVTQTPSAVKVDCYFWEEDSNGQLKNGSRTLSESLMEDFILKGNGLYELLFYYRQNGSSDSSIPIREGFNSLTYYKKDNATWFSGSYFAKNSLSKGNGGSICVRYETNELNHLSNGQ